MNSTEQIPFHVEINRIIDLLASQIYQSPLALLRENGQNAYDAVLQRIYLRQSFDPRIDITIEPNRVVTSDNGIGMTKSDLINHYWKAGSSGKNNAEARAAGVVGTFGIGAMANFGVATSLKITTESAMTGERTISEAYRDTLSVTEDCIEIRNELPIGQPGTTITAEISDEKSLNVEEAVKYIEDCLGYIPVKVFINGRQLEIRDFESGVGKPPNAEEFSYGHATLGTHLKADVKLLVGQSGEVRASLENIVYDENAIKGTMVLRQGAHQIRTYRSSFSLTTAAVASDYAFGGVADMTVLEPTAGREALTTSSLQILQIIVQELESFVSLRIAEWDAANANTGFLSWVVSHGRYDLCENLEIRMEPDGRSIKLSEVREATQIRQLNYFEGSDHKIIESFATTEQPLIILTARPPRRRCEQEYLSRYCHVTKVADSPSVLDLKPDIEWTLAESGLVFRLVNIIESDYFLTTEIGYGLISHNLPLLVDLSNRPVRITLNPESSTISPILELYQTDYNALTGFAKDFIRNAIFPKIAKLVPSSTRQGAEAFLKTLRQPRDVFEYEENDLGKISEIWEDYLEGKISLSVAAAQSTTFVKASVQVIDPNASSPASSVILDVLENEALLQNIPESDEEEYPALPAITRLDQMSDAKLLTIEDVEDPLRGYRCFIALSNRIREKYGDFFLQPHRTSIVWGGQKTLFIFQHHSGEFGLYYELQGSELFSDSPGGFSIPTCTVVLKNQVYIPVPDEIRRKFILSEEAPRRRFEIRGDLLFPDSKQNGSVN